LADRELDPEASMLSRSTVVEMVAAAVLIASSFGAVEQPKAETPRQRYEALFRDYQAAGAAWTRSGETIVSDDPLWIKHYADNPLWDFTARLLQFAEENRQDRAALDALLKVVEISGVGRDRASFPSVRRAVDMLIADHLQDEWVIQTFLRRSILGGPNMEAYLRALLAKGRDRDMLGRACMSLVRCINIRMNVAARPFFDHPEDHPDRLAATKYLDSRLDPDYIAYIRTADPVALMAEREALLERVVNEFGDVPAVPKWATAKAKSDERTLGDSAKAALYSIQSLAVGKVAPEIEGEDIDAKSMKLSEHRGKVVVLVFWGTWCAPCMASIPREKVMVERLKGRPFALIGINSDSDRVKLKSVIAEKGITWRSWWDRDPARGPIATRWDVHAWPTVIVLDAKGVIRFRGLGFLRRPEMLDEAVDSLLKADPRHSLTKEQASGFARLALKGLSKEYPNKPEHVMAAQSDVKSPRALHPAFYGSYDWHSSVHGHWMLVRLLREFPELPESRDIRSVLNEHLAAEAIKAEADYFARKESKPFERPYGWAWLLKLAEELNGWDDSDARNWSKNLRPLADAVVARYLEFFPKQTYPIRTGVHPNTAFGLSFAHDYALAVRDTALKQLVEARARNYYVHDADAPARWEPGGADFFSPTLIEADLMRRVLPPAEFRDWFKRFLPGADKGEPKSLFVPAAVTDRTDPQLVHLDGLNLSRAWAMRSIASALPEGDPARMQLLSSSVRHAEAALAHVASGDYAGEHWLASFAVYLLTTPATR
jgi:thiol-disulfide isomerase/thioredoxin